MERVAKLCVLLIGAIAVAVSCSWGRTAVAGEDAAPGLVEGRYRLVEGSVLTVDTGGPVPPVEVPLAGRFWVHVRSRDSCSALYGLLGVRLSAPQAGGSGFEAEGRGEFEIICAVPEPQEVGARNVPLPVERSVRMRLLVRAKGPDDELKLVFEGGPVADDGMLPWIELSLVQVEPGPEPGRPSFRIRFVAAPWPVVRFSTDVRLTAGAGGSPRPVSDGDLLDSRGRVLKTNHELTARLGIMPIVPDLGLDALLGRGAVSPAEEVIFSLEESAFSETLGRRLDHGDLLSDAGSVFRGLGELLEAFAPALQTEEIGLDAASPGPAGSVFFSTESAFFSGTLGRRVEHGALLVDTGAVYRTEEDLLSRFHPEALPVGGVGLDAAYVWPHGEVWFSTDTEFVDRTFGLVGHGDLLSERGWVVARNLELVAPFEPLEDLADFGLDALSIGTGNVFAGCGILVEAPEGCILFEAEGGQRYLLENRGPFGVGDRIWVTGFLDPGCVSVCFAPCIRDNVVAPCFKGCGRLERIGECILFAPDDSRILFHIDNLGGFGAGDHVEVTGVLDTECRPPSWCEVLPVAFAGCIEGNTITACRAREEFLRGETNQDGTVDLSDAVFILAYLFKGGPPPCRTDCPEEPCCCYDLLDTNDSGDVNIADAVYLLMYLFIGGDPPPVPFPDCGPDPTPDDLVCRGVWCP